MKVLHIDKLSLIEIKKVKEYAEKNIITKQKILNIKDGIELPIGDDPNYVCFVNPFYRVVYSIENQYENKFHHLSISIEEESRIPSIQVVEIILSAFGIKDNNISDQFNIWIENISKDRKAVNVLSYYK